MDDNDENKNIKLYISNIADSCTSTQLVEILEKLDGYVTSELKKIDNKIYGYVIISSMETIRKLLTNTESELVIDGKVLHFSQHIYDKKKILSKSFIEITGTIDDLDMIRQQFNEMNVPIGLLFKMSDRYSGCSLSYVIVEIVNRTDYDNLLFLNKISNDKINIELRKETAKTPHFCLSNFVN